MITVVVVREGILPLGAEEAVNEADGRVLLVGTGTRGGRRGTGGCHLGSDVLRGWRASARDLGRGPGR